MNKAYLFLLYLKSILTIEDNSKIAEIIERRSYPISCYRLKGVSKSTAIASIANLLFEH